MRTILFSSSFHPLSIFFPSSFRLLSSLFPSSFYPFSILFPSSFRLLFIFFPASFYPLSIFFPSSFQPLSIFFLSFFHLPSKSTFRQLSNYLNLELLPSLMSMNFITNRILLICLQYYGLVVMSLGKKSADFHKRMIYLNIKFHYFKNHR